MKWITPVTISISILFFSFAQASNDFPWPMYLPAITIANATVIWNGKEWQREVVRGQNRNNWEGSKVYCQELVLGGHSDWRLPTKDELKSLVVCTNGHPVPLDDTHGCNDDGYSDDFVRPTMDASLLGPSSFYWSSTGYNADNSWMVSFYFGYAVWYKSDLLQYARCVREPS
jgi:hypothetical protein